MKKIFILILIVILSFNSANAVEEIKLETEKNKFDYLSDVYYGKVENANPVLKLFSEKGLQFENSRINSIKARFLYSGELTFLKTEGEGLSTKHDFGVIEPAITTRLNDNKTEIEFSYNLMRQIKNHPNGFTRRISTLYVSHDITENQKILFGQGSRLPTNFNGSISTMQQEFVIKSQIGRTLGDARSVGIRNIAKYKYLEYDIGIYDSTRYMMDFGRGLDFTGYLMFKPFADFNEKIGKVRLGTSYNYGEYNNSYSQYSVFLGYDYNKLHFRSEYANADGYNTKVCLRDKADGFYTSFAYDITPKISILGRYDYLNPNKNISNDTSQEFTVGITYNLLKNLKLMFNFVRREYSNKEDSNMILFATRFII